MKKLTHNAPQQPAEDTPAEKFEALQLEAQARNTLEKNARNAGTAVSEAAAKVTTVENAVLRGHQSENALDQARAEHWSARKAEAVASDALAHHQAKFPTLAADVSRAAAQVEFEKLAALDPEYRQLVVKVLARWEGAASAVQEMNSFYQNAFAEYPEQTMREGFKFEIAAGLEHFFLDETFGNSFNGGALGLFKRNLANSYPDLLNPEDPIRKNAERVKAYIADHERDGTTGTSPHAARAASIKPKPTLVESEKPAGVIAGLKSVFGLA